MKLIIILCLFTLMVACGKKPQDNPVTPENDITIEEIATNDESNREQLKNAIISGDVEMVRSQLRENETIEYIFKDQDTPLTKAIRLGHHSIIIDLINASKDLNFSNAHGETPLTLAVRNKLSGIVNTLITRDIDLNLPDKLSGSSPLGYAVIMGQINIANNLIKHGANFKALDVPSQLSIESWIRGLGYKKLIKLIESINSHTQVSLANLKRSIRKGHVSFVKYLIINFEEYLNMINENNLLIEILKVKNELARKDLFEFVLNIESVDINNVFGGTPPIIYTLKNNLHEEMNKLLMRNARLDTRDKFNMNALHYSVSYLNLYLTQKFYDQLENDLRIQMHNLEPRYAQALQNEFNIMIDDVCTYLPTRRTANRRNLGFSRSKIRNILSCY